MECMCCFSEIAPGKHVRCSGDIVHTFCRECPKAALEAEINRGTIEYKCIGDENCNGIFTQQERRFFLSRRGLRRISILEAKLSISKANIDGIYYCPRCSYAVICSDTELDGIFDCPNKKCKKSTCMKCKRESHDGEACNVDVETQLRRQKEEAETMKHVVVCPICSLTIVKDEGCNKVKCTCGVSLCWICKEDISAEMYMHFGRTKEDGTVCHLFPDSYTADSDQEDNEDIPDDEDGYGSDDGVSSIASLHDGDIVYLPDSSDDLTNRILEHTIARYNEYNNAIEHATEMYRARQEYRIPYRRVF